MARLPGNVSGGVALVVPRAQVQAEGPAVVDEVVRSLTVAVRCQPMEWSITCRITVIQTATLAVSIGERLYYAALAGQTIVLVRGQKVAKAFPVQNRTSRARRESWSGPNRSARHC